MDRHYKDILLLAERQCNAKRGQSLLYFRYGKRIRKQIESAFSKWLVGSQDVSMQYTNQGPYPQIDDLDYRVHDFLSHFLGGNLGVINSSNKN